ncbi:MAG: HAMP domain-containing histidine kinase [Rhizobiaceae bacterium]|nr:HAMP domain-containing histidine kinase [Rhizobiaceae bacterium]
MNGVRVRTKWRPQLGLIVFSVLIAVLALPAAIVIWFRALDGTSSQMGPVEVSALLVAFAITLAVAYILTRTVTAPIDALIARTEEIRRGGRAAIQPLKTYGTREIATLSQSFLDLAAQLVDRTEYMRSFAAHVSHELKSPLTAIKGAAELLRDDDADKPITPEERRHFLDNIVADADRLDSLLKRLRELAYAELPTVTGETTVAEIATELARRFPKLAVKAEGDATGRLALSLEAGTIIFSHLADNAVQHGATQLCISASQEKSRAIIVVADNGSGISEGNRDLIFQPFFSTRREAGGTGMGLEITQAMLKSHGSSIRLAESTEAGAAFELVVPVIP